MSVLNISTAVIKDAALFLEYVAKAGALLNSLQVEVLCRGRFQQTVRGAEMRPHIVAVFRFADMEHVRRFYEAAEYRPLIPLRDAACEMTIQLYED